MENNNNNTLEQQGNESVIIPSVFCLDKSKWIDMAIAALKHAGQSKVVLPDFLQRHNWLCSDRTIKKAIQNSNDDGLEFAALLNNYAPLAMHILHWRQIYESPIYQHQIAAIKNYYNVEDRFATLVDELAREKLSQKFGGRCVDDSSSKFKKRLDYTIEYVVEELPSLLCGISIDGVWHTVIKHPVMKNMSQTTKLDSLLERIHFSGEFQPLRDSMPEYRRAQVIHIDVTNDLSSVPNALPADDTSAQQESIPQRVMIIITAFSFIAFSIILLPRFTFFLASAILLVWLFKWMAEEWLTYRHRWRDSNGNLIPSSKLSLPHGDVPLLRNDHDGLALNRLWQQLGKPPVYQIWMGPKPFLMIAHASTAKEFYRDAVNHKRNRDLELGWVLESIFGKGIGVLDRKEWKQTKRPYWSTCFGATHVRNFNNIINEYVNHYVHTLHGKVNVQEKLLTLMMDITIYVIYGKVSKDEREELSSLMNLQDELLGHMLGSVTAMFPIFKKLWFLPLNKKLHDYHTRWNKINVDIMRRFQEQGEDSPFTNSLFFHIAPMFAPNDDGHPNSLQDIQWEEMIDTVSEAVLGPVYGAGGTLSWPFILLAAHPEVQEELRSLIDSEFQGVDVNPADLTPDVLRRIPLLDGVIAEARRLHSIFTITAPEITASDALVEKDIIVSVDVPSLNMNPAVWGDDATKFRPHRHLQETPEYSNHGFGLGPRKCLAIFFTSVVQRLLIMLVLQNYTVSIDDNLKEKYHQGHRFPTTKHPFIFVPNVELTFKRRVEAQA